jgi:NADH:ubiquinone oxidoreductase subunit E
MTNKKIIYQAVSPEVLGIVEAHHHGPESMLEVLKDIQSLPSGLTAATITDAARALDVPPHQAYGMATFYSMLSLEQRKNILRVCDGPVCWLKKAGKQSSVISDELVGEWANAMPEYMVERTSCLGLCDRAPAILVNDEQAGPVSSEAANKVCEGWRGIPTDYSHVRKGETRVMTALIGKIDPDPLTTRSSTVFMMD